MNATDKKWRKIRAGLPKDDKICPPFPKLSGNKESCQQWQNTKKKRIGDFLQDAAKQV